MDTEFALQLDRVALVGASVGRLMGGVLVVLLIMILAGTIAYVGDRVGHQVGRKRLTLFGLRPKYTSTIVAVGTGMLIALVVTGGALLASNYVRTAFFRIGSLTTRINELQAQSIAQEKEVHETRNGLLRVSKYTLIANTAWTFDLNRTDDEQMPDFSRFFDAVVRIANQQLTTPQIGLKPYAHKSGEADIQKNLRKQLALARDKSLNAHALVLFLPIAYQNLFRGETIAFTFQGFEDRKLASAGETLASIDVSGGTASLDTTTLVTRAAQTLAARNYPPQFLYPPLINSTQATAVASQLPRLRGRYRVIAKTPIDLYPHSGPFPIDVALVPIR